MKRLGLVFCIIYLTIISLWGQFNQEIVFYKAGHRIERYAEKNGVMKPEINSILEDSNGYLWFSNIDYLLRFDGYEFKKYKLPKNELLEGRINYFNQLIEDKEGYIWISIFMNAGGGFLRFNPGTEKFLRVRNRNDSLSDILAHNYINHIVKDKFGQLWSGGINGLTKITTKDSLFTTQIIASHIISTDSIEEVIPFLDKDGHPFALTDKGVFTMKEIKNKRPCFEKVQNKLLGYPTVGIHTNISGVVWLPSTTLSYRDLIGEDYLYTFDTEEHALQQIQHGLPENSGLVNIEEDEFGNLWLGTIHKGLFKLSPPFLDIKDTLNQPNIEYINIWNLPNKEFQGNIRSLKIDSKNNLWFGSRQLHLFKVQLTDSPLDFINLFEMAQLPSQVGLSNIFEDSESNVWLSPFPKQALIKYNTITKKLDRVIGFNGENNFLLNVLDEDKHKNILVGGTGKIYRYNLQTKKADEATLAGDWSDNEGIVPGIVKDNQGNYWTWLYNGPANILPAASNQYLLLPETVNGFNGEFKYVGHIIKDNEQGVWMLMNNGYGDLLHLTYQNGQFDTLYQKPFFSYTPRIAQDSKGNIWAANGSGLLKIDIKKDTTFLFSIENGLRNDMVTDLVIDEVDDIWIYTPLGIAKFNKTIECFINYRTLEDFSPSYAMSKSLTINKEGIIHAITKKGFISFDPKKIKKSEILPTIFISEIKASGKSILSKQPNGLKSASNEFSLSHFQNNLSINYIGINFDDAPKQQYKYQLEGINENWVDAGTERTARFPNLPPSTYTFKVKAANADGIWSEPKRIKITILPPWWKTWWAYAFYILATIGGVFWYIQSLRKKVIQKQQQLDKELTLNNELTLLNQANQRFVPNDFLQILGKDSIKDLQLGDQTKTKMTVLFSDIRDYTPLSESMTPEQNFKFINSYLGRVGPIIKANGGFISTYLGDGLMALFVNEPENAIRATIEIQHALDKYNQERRASGKRPLKTGMGLNTGDLMLGVIGDEHRYESTVISDAVNTASRMEGLTKVFGAAIILSERTLADLRGNFPSPRKLNSLSHKSEGERKSPPDQHFAYRYLGKVKVKGKDKALKIYDLYEGEMVAIRQLKARTHDQFERGIDYYYNRDFGKAAECFKQVLSINGNDKAAQYYLDKSVGYIMNGVAEDWSGVEEMVMK